MQTSKHCGDGTGAAFMSQAETTKYTKGTDYDCEFTFGNPTFEGLPDPDNADKSAGFQLTYES